MFHLEDTAMREMLTCCIDVLRVLNVGIQLFYGRRECRAENVAPRGDCTATGLRTKPSAEQIQPGAYDLYRSCRLRIKGKPLASSGSVCVCNI